MKQIILFFGLVIALFSQPLQTQAQVKIGLLKYGGGGDWYANPTSLPNLAAFINSNTTVKANARIETVEAGSSSLFQYNFLHTTGHGNIVFSDSERRNLKAFLLNGGFLHIDDNYGMAPYFFKEVKKLFPDRELKPIPPSYPMYSAWFSFPQGLPKIHEHDGKTPQAFGIFDGERLVLLFTTETDLGDGWEDVEVHNDSPESRELALKMGTNIVIWAISQ